MRLRNRVDIYADEHGIEVGGVDAPADFWVNLLDKLTSRTL